MSERTRADLAARAFLTLAALLPYWRLLTFGVIYITDDNGVVTEATGDWNDIELLSHREVTIQIGTPIDEIPNYTWSAH